jgi:hypothetical protein
MITMNCSECGKLIQVSGPLTPGNPPVCWKCSDPEIHIDVNSKVIAIPITEHELAEYVNSWFR